jgi:hypothetical protein
MDDFRPMLYHSADWGETWRVISGGLPEDHFTRVLRADPAQAGLLYAGTERGLYHSRDGGESWAPLQLNLPIVPITDLQVKGDDLIAATQGRGFWILDDLERAARAGPRRCADGPRPVCAGYGLSSARRRSRR